MSSQPDSSGYIEEILVKISEYYKPPPIINLAVTYSQRLNLNKEIQDNIQNYEFTLEKGVLSKTREWKAFRKEALEQRKARVNRLKMILKENESTTQQDSNEIEINSINPSSSVANSANEYDLTSSTTNSLCNQNVPNQNYSIPYSSCSNLLIPTQAPLSSKNMLTPTPIITSNILTPTPINNTITSNVSMPMSLYNSNHNSKPVDKSPFDISDFEADTSSPFDNVELKTINDMEELARVLKTDDSYSIPKPKQNSFYYYHQPVQSDHTQLNFSGYPLLGNQYNNCNSNYGVGAGASGIDVHQYPQYQSQISSYNFRNDYYPVETLPAPATLSYQPTSNFCNNTGISKATNSLTASSVELKTSSRSVPDLVQALESELENTHIRERKESYPNRYSMLNSPGRPKSIDSVYPKEKSKKETLENPYTSLPKDLQDLSQVISSMGFPLARVARTCKLIGDDYKKVVEHLLVMSELLDLGFSEKDVAMALFECDNDRDKALDKLIS